MNTGCISTREFCPYRESYAYWQREAGGPLSWGWGPWRYEKHFGFSEPVTVAGPRRTLIWQARANTAPPPGWRFSFLIRGLQRTGYLSTPLYPTNWTENARRNLQHWQNQTRAIIVTPTAEEWRAAYAASPLARRLKKAFLSLWNKKRARHGARVDSLLVKDKMTGVPLAGLGFLHVPEISSSVHLLSFNTPSGKELGAGFGLIWEWGQRAANQGIGFLDLDILWAPGDPRSWRGFSRFKEQFRPQIIDYPRPLVKRVGSWLNR